MKATNNAAYNVFTESSRVTSIPIVGAIASRISLDHNIILLMSKYYVMSFKFDTSVRVKVIVERIIAFAAKVD